MIFHNQQILNYWAKYAEIHYIMVAFNFIIYVNLRMWNITTIWVAW
jgi:hypothetical protein